MQKILFSIYTTMQNIPPDDRAVFPPDMTYKVSITEADITVAGVSLNNQVLDGVGLRAMFRTKVGARMFNVTRSERINL